MITMYDAEKRTLELLMKGERVAQYIQTNYLTDVKTTWYIHGKLAFIPQQDFIRPEIFSSHSNKFPDVWERVVTRYRDRPHYFVTAQKTELYRKKKLVPLVPTDENHVFLKHILYEDIKPWLGKKWRHVFIPEEYSWKGGVLLVLNQEHHHPCAFILPFRKDDEA